MANAHDFMWQDLLEFKLGKLERYLYHILRAVGAIPTSARDGKDISRPSDEVIKNGLQD